MISKPFVVAVAILFSFSATAQSNSVPVDPHYCGQFNHQQSIYDFKPSQRILDSIDQANFQLEYENFLTTFDPNARSTYTVPVVVHVVHQNGVGNISDAQVKNAIENLNEDFSMANADLVNTIPAFAGIIGNGDVEFVLATKDPNGNCHSGITRTVSSTTFDTGRNGASHPIVDAVAAEHGIWPQGDYMSIFVCRDPNGNAGYTNFPSNFFNPNLMYGAIFMRQDYMGMIGTGSSGRRHTISHEVGHWLNLPHLWGFTNTPELATNCNSDDGVADTPNTIGRQACTQGSSCGSLDNTQNIMEYSGCPTMFTQGQVARMHAALNSSVAGRNNLFTSANLLATGVTSVPELCKAEFKASHTKICAGGTVDFSDLSFQNVSSRTWIFAGGSPSTSTDSVVAVTYSSPGTYAVEISVTDGVTNLVETKVNYITVFDDNGVDLPMLEGFESISVFPNNSDFFSSELSGSYDWQLTSDVSSSGSNALFYDNFSQGSSGATVDFQSGIIDLSTLLPAEDILFSFDYAYRKRIPSNNDRLRVYASYDCGVTWDLRKTLQGNLLSNEVTGANYQANPADFKTETLTNISSLYYGPNFRYRFEFISDGGNNIYIDNINIFRENLLSNASLEAEKQISLFPNPVKNLLTIQWDKDPIESYQIISASGQLIAVNTQPILNSERVFTVDTETLASGIYYITLINKNTIITEKFIKQ